MDTGGEEHTQAGTRTPTVHNSVAGGRELSCYSVAELLFRSILNTSRKCTGLNFRLLLSV